MSLALTSAADAGAWFVLTRSYGCTALKHLADAERLPRVPTSPKDYADMMRSRGHEVKIGTPPGLPPHMTDKAVMVSMQKDNRVFVQEEICEKPKDGQR